MNYDDLDCFNIRFDKGVLFVNIDHPPLNLMNMALLLDLYELSQRCEFDDEVKVIVFDSDDPDFFIAHGDVTSMINKPSLDPERGTELGFVHKTLDRFGALPKITIAKIKGAARGGGSEFALAMDMRFGAIGKALFGQPEAVLGIIPGAGGSQRLPRLIGKARALEMILGCADIDAKHAERYGYLNRALAADEIDDYVDNLAYAIASLPVDAITAAKKLVNQHSDADLLSGMIEEEYRCAQLLQSDQAKHRMQFFLDNGGQQREIEIAHNAFNRLFASWTADS